MTAKNTLSKDKNPGQAKWCATHQRLECTKTRTKGRGECHQCAVKGTNACKNHSGYKLATLKAKGEAAITAWNPLSNRAPTVDAPSAVLSVLQMSYLRLGVYSSLLKKQIAAEGAEAGDVQDGDTSGLIGFRYGMGGKDGILYRQSEEVRALVVLEAGERDRVVKYAKVAHDMGISDRLTSMAEHWGDVVAGRVSLLLTGLGLTPEQNLLVPGLLREHLGSIDMDAIEAAPE